MQGKWTRNTGKYSTGDVYMNTAPTLTRPIMPTRSRDDSTIWRASIELPGIVMKPETTDFATEAEAKTRLENAVATWFKWLEN